MLIFSVGDQRLKIQTENSPSIYQKTENIDILFKTARGKKSYIQCSRFIKICCKLLLT